MAFDYHRVRATADRLLVRYGQSGYLRRVTGGTGGDPWNPSSQAGAATVDYPAVLAPMSISAFDRSATLIESDKDLVLMSAEGLTVVPTDADFILYADGSIHAISAVRTTAPGGTAVLYELDCVK